MDYKHTTNFKMFSPQKYYSCLYFRKNLKYLIAGLLRIVQVFAVSCKTVYLWVMTNCSFMRDILIDCYHRAVDTYAWLFEFRLRHRFLATEMVRFAYFDASVNCFSVRGTHFTQIKYSVYMI